MDGVWYGFPFFRMWSEQEWRITLSDNRYRQVVDKIYGMRFAGNATKFSRRNEFTQWPWFWPVHQLHSLAHFDNLGNESNKPHTPNHIVPFFIHNWNETKSVDSLANLIRLQIFCVQPHSLVRSHVDLFTLWIFEATLHFTIYVFMMGHRHFAKLTMRLIIHHYCRQ